MRGGRQLSQRSPRKYECLKDYYSQEDLLDYLREDTAEMQGFFSWLDFVTLNLERIITACTHYLIYAREEEKNIDSI